MDYLIPGLLFFGIPLFMLLYFKSNAGVMFLAACAGVVLLSSLDTTFVATAGSVVPGDGEAVVSVATVMFVIVLTGLFFRKTVHGMMRFAHLFIVLLVGLLLWSQVPELVNVSWLSASTDKRSWEVVRDFQSLIIATGLALSLVAVMTLGSKHTNKKHH